MRGVGAHRFQRSELAIIKCEKCKLFGQPKSQTVSECSRRASIVDRWSSLFKIQRVFIYTIIKANDWWVNKEWKKAEDELKSSFPNATELIASNSTPDSIRRKLEEVLKLMLLVWARESFVITTLSNGAHGNVSGNKTTQIISSRDIYKWDYDIYALSTSI